MKIKYPVVKVNIHASINFKSARVDLVNNVLSEIKSFRQGQIGYKLETLGAAAVPARYGLYSRHCCKRHSMYTRKMYGYY